MTTSASAAVRQFSIRRASQSGSERTLDTVAVEEPLAIRLQYWFKGAQQSEDLALTMRTPGHDIELAVGFLFSEGIIQSRRDLKDVRSLGPGASNELLIELSPDVDLDTQRLSRATMVNSGCGVCGKRNLESIRARVRNPAADTFSIPATLINHLPEILRGHQQEFARTGGLHAAASIDPRGAVDAAFEDVGRHNALDKLIGWCLLNDRLPLANRLLFLSSRSSFELVQKAAAAGAPVLAAVGGPSSLAIDSARQVGLTLIGFVRDQRFNIYSGEWRLNS